MNMFYGYSPTAAILSQQYLPGGALSTNGSAKFALNGGTITTTPALLRDFQNGRHGGFNNVLFVDGHVTSIPSQITGSAFYINVNNTNLFTGLFARWDKR